jgi:hypothetical protein
MRKSTVTRLGDFNVSVPPSYTVVEHRFRLNRILYGIARFVHRFRGGEGKELPRIKLWKSYEIEIGNHSLTLTCQHHGEPEDLADEILSMCKNKIELEPFAIGACKGVKCGRYEEPWTTVIWRVKKRDCMIIFCLQGDGIPSDEVQRDIDQILERTTYVGSA